MASSLYLPTPTVAFINISPCAVESFRKTSSTSAIRSFFMLTFSGLLQVFGNNGGLRSQQGISRFPALYGFLWSLNKRFVLLSGLKGEKFYFTQRSDHGIARNFNFCLNFHDYKKIKLSQTKINPKNRFSFKSTPPELSAHCSDKIRACRCENWWWRLLLLSLWFFFT